MLGIMYFSKRTLWLKFLLQSCSESRESPRSVEFDISRFLGDGVPGRDLMDAYTTGGQKINSTEFLFRPT